MYVPDNLGPMCCLLCSKSLPFMSGDRAAPTLAPLLPSSPLGGTFAVVYPTDDSCFPDHLVLACLAAVAAPVVGFEACEPRGVSGFEVRMSFMREKASSILLARKTFS